MGCGLPDEGRERDEEKPGMDMVNSKLEELVGETAMKQIASACNKERRR